MFEERLSAGTVNLINPATGNLALYTKCIFYKDGSLMNDSHVDGINYRKVGYEYFQLSGSGGSTSFNGDRAITRAISGAQGVNPGGNDVAAFLNNLFYPAVAPVEGLSIDRPTREVGENPAYTLSWSVTAETNPVTSIIVDGNIIAPNGGNQNGQINGVLPAAMGSYTKNMSASDGVNNGSASCTVSYYYRYFYGPAAAAAANSADARALNSDYCSGGNTPQLNTGTVYQVFEIIIPPGHSLSSVIDQDALNLDITSEYVLIDANFTVNDAAGAAVPGFKKYVKTNSVPYPANHRHNILIS